MKKCDCKIMNTLSRYPKVWPWLGVAGYALDGAELVLKHTRWGKMNYKARMLVHGAGAGLLCLGAGVHTAQAAAAGSMPRQRSTSHRAAWKSTPRTACSSLKPPPGPHCRQW